MIYAKQLQLPKDLTELKFIEKEKRTCFHTFYPFKIFPDKGLTTLDFDGITLLYGGNGSGKSTLINVMARKMGAIRYSEFNGAPFFDDYVALCSVEYNRMPHKCCVLSSDDVFDYALNARSVNESIDEQRNALIDRYIAVHHGAPPDSALQGMDDFERWREIREILSPKKSQSSYIRARVVRDVNLMSNGETAMQYFIDRIDEDGVYFLDEPENSLSIALQIELAEYIEATARATRTQFVIATHSPIFLSMHPAKIYNLDASPASVCRWTELPNVRKYFEFFMRHRDEFSE